MRSPTIAKSEEIDSDMREMHQRPPKRSRGYRVANLNHPSSQPMQVVIDASPSGVTKERSQSYQRPLQAKSVQTIAQTTAPTPKRPNRATSAPKAFPSIFDPRIRQGGLHEYMAKSR